MLESPTIWLDEPRPEGEGHYRAIRDGALVVSIFGVVYFGVAMVTGVPEARATLSRFARR